jgi:hypothetical protein
MSFNYGKTTPTSYTEIVAINKSIACFGRAVKLGAYLVDMSILRFVSGYLSQLKVWHQKVLALFNGQLDMVRR